LTVDFSRAPEVFVDSRTAAECAGLEYRTDDAPGISRRRHGKGFTYVGPQGGIVKDATALARIRALAIPPAWTDVWISPDKHTHLDATGKDAKGRKQYRYNPEFVRMRDAAKFEHLMAFAHLLPKLRKRVAHDMAKSGLKREKVLATIVHLLEETGSRIGNEAYARDNRSFGLTTLRNRHVRVRGDELRFLFKGKSGKTWQFSVRSRRVANIVRACQDIPGQHLFEYRDESGDVRKVGSGDVNAYLRQITGEDISAKDFRTWAGTVEAAVALKELASAERKSAKADVRAALQRAAGRLGNTVAICRKCYVHPAVISNYEAGEFALELPANARKPAAKFALTPQERAVLRFLETHTEWEST
jgi:DNA topoisomerase-1